MDLAQTPLALLFAIFAAAAVAVWFLGVRLTHTLDQLAERTGLGRALVGMLLLGGITSLPELANVLTASTAGEPRLAINNLLGSAAINVFLLAAVDAVVGRRAVTAVAAHPSTLMMCALSILVLILVAAAVVVGDRSLLGVSLWSLAISLCSLVFFILAAGYERRAPWRVNNRRQSGGEGDGVATDRPLRALIITSVIAAALIFVAGYTLSVTGDVIAERTGLGSGVVGFLLIGFATSMPELSTIVTALRLNRPEMAFGQVLGTNFVNLSLFLVADLAYRDGSVIDTLGRFEAILALLGAFLTGLFLVGLLERKDPRIMRMGYDSLAVVLVFAAVSAFLVVTR